MQRIENYCASTNYSTATPSATCAPAGTPYSSVCQSGTYKLGNGSYRLATPTSSAACLSGSSMLGGVCKKNNEIVGGPTPRYYCQR